MISCERNRTIDDKVINEIFPQLIDSIRICRTNLILPIPPPPFYDEDSNFIEVNYIPAKRIVEQNERLVRQVDSIDSRLLIGVVDTCLSIDFFGLLRKSYQDSLNINKIINNNRQFYKPLIKWNLERIQPPVKYQLMLKSDLYERYTDIWRIEDRKFGGLIAISRIYYSKDKFIGLFQFEKYPFYREGTSYFVIIEWIDGKWIIKKILMNWIS